MTSRRSQIAARTALTLALLALAVALVCVAALRVDVQLGSTNGGGQTRLTLVILLAGAVQAGCLLTILVAIGWADRLDGTQSGPLYLPVMLTAGGITLVLGLSGLSAFALLHWGLHESHWRWLAEPEVRLLSAAGLAVVVVSLGWKAVVLLTGRGWRCRWVVALYAAQAVLTALIVAVAVWG